MERHLARPRTDFEEVVTDDGLSKENRRWREDRFYVLSKAEVTTLVEASEVVYAMLLGALDRLIEDGDLGRVGIPEHFRSLVELSWRDREPSLFGRLDLAIDQDGTPKLLGFHGDTPGSFLESGCIQKRWQHEMLPGLTQFNSMDCDLGASMLRLFGGANLVDFLVIDSATEETDCVQYLRKIAISHDLPTRLLPLRDAFYREESKTFHNKRTGMAVTQVCKLYPWDRILSEMYPHLEPLRNVTVFEPAWKMAIDSKAILAVLWEMYPGHPYLVPAYTGGPRSLTSYISKPLFGRKGCNLRTYIEGEVVTVVSGPFTWQPRVYQEYVIASSYAGWKPTFGVWMVGEKPSSIGIRESHEYGGNSCIFVPHVVA